MRMGPWSRSKALRFYSESARQRFFQSKRRHDLSHEPFHRLDHRFNRDRTGNIKVDTDVLYAGLAVFKKSLPHGQTVGGIAQVRKRIPAQRKIDFFAIPPLLLSELRHESEFFRHLRNRHAAGRMPAVAVGRDAP